MTGTIYLVVEKASAGQSRRGEWRVRTATTGDERDCARLAAAVVGSADRQTWIELFATDIREDTRHLVVAEAQADARVVGYGRAVTFAAGPAAPLNAAPDGYYLTGLIVDPGCRRMGVGSELVAARVAWVAHRADEAFYFANAANTASIRLHERFGFVEVTKDFWFPGLTFNGGRGVLYRAAVNARA